MLERLVDLFKRGKDKVTLASRDFIEYNRALAILQDYESQPKRYHRYEHTEMLPHEVANAQLTVDLYETRNL